MNQYRHKFSSRAKMLKHVLTLCVLFVPAALGDLCSIDGTTTVRADQATSTIPCKTFTGSIAVATDAERAFFLRGVEEIQGTLEVSVQRINYLDLGELQKVDRFHVVATGITDMAYRNLHTVKDLAWDSVPMEGNSGNPQIKHVDRLSLVFTGIKDLGEVVNLETVDFVHIANNSAMMNVTLPNLKTVTDQLEIRDNSVGATVSFPELEWAEKISVEQIGASSSWVAEWDGNFTTLDLPKLVEVRGDFNIKDNAKLGSVNAPLLTNVRGNLEVTGSPELEIMPFEALKSVGGNLRYAGSFKNLSSTVEHTIGQVRYETDQNFPCLRYYGSDYYYEGGYSCRSASSRYDDISHTTTTPYGGIATPTPTPTPTPSSHNHEQGGNGLKWWEMFIIAFVVLTIFGTVVGRNVLRNRKLKAKRVIIPTVNSRPRPSSSRPPRPPRPSPPPVNRPAVDRNKILPPPPASAMAPPPRYSDEFGREK